MGRRVSLRKRKEKAPSRENEETELGQTAFFLCLLDENPTPAELRLQFRRTGNFGRVAFATSARVPRIIGLATVEREQVIAHDH
jgi:hypothetical protein